MVNPPRLKIRARGVVQGVGFRPFVCQLAQRFQLTGWVKNDGQGVEVVAQGEQVELFLAALKKEAPAPVKNLVLSYHAIPAESEERGFQIRPSDGDNLNTHLPSDSPPCRACLAELFDPTSRYYRYPFITCSHCGPRYTVTHKLPYDRCHTSMAKFKLCPPCLAEYHNPNHRRFHAQATSCAHCGPRLSLPIDDILAHILAGKIVALKGVGGFHLLCDAQNDAAVSALRIRKNRYNKPLAIMVANVASAQQWVHCDAHGKAVLESNQRPIVLLEKKGDTPLSPQLAPRLTRLGIMLPYSPLHYLLFHQQNADTDDLTFLAQPQTLAFVMTSGNVPGEPTIIDNAEARLKLNTIADVIIDHDRDIVARCDDSVVRPLNKQTLLLRRARGYVAEAIELPYDIPATLALGGHKKNTFCLTRGNEAFLSPHLGNIDNRSSIDALEQTLAHMKKLLNIKPERVAHDLHPDFFTTHYAHTRGLPCLGVQHHHAHLAAVSAEHHLTQPALGLVLDGFGLGSDNTAWGGELLLFDARHYQRLGHLKHLLLPGGDLAAREPWRTAAGFLSSIKKENEIKHRYAHFPLAQYIHQQLDKNINCPRTSSGGRLFDLASSLLNVQHRNHFDGEAAMYLESLVTTPAFLPDGWRIANNILDMTPLLTYLLACDSQTGANLFHGTLILALATWLRENCAAQHCHHVVLAGGCLANSVLTNGLTARLEQHAISVYIARQTAINDGGLSLGQAWIAGHGNIAVD